MNTWIEWFGMLASVVVAISLTLKNIKRLRLVNLVGALAFAVYGFAIGSWPVFGLNAFIVFINTFYLFQMMQEEKRSETFDVLFVDPCKDKYARRFLTFHGADMRRFFPSFNADPCEGSLVGAEACFILRETLPVSLVAFKRKENGEIALLIDYAIPAYRDFKNARFFFETAAHKIASSDTIFTAAAEVRAHVVYLEKIGFKKVGKTAAVTLFRKNIRVSS
ncbi:hypothetical protein MASR2M78_25120 [Treponema sp.]